MNANLTHFLKTAFGFLLPMIIVLAAAEFRFSQIPNHVSKRKQILEAHLADLDVLILGNSQAALGILPGAITPHTYTMAGFSQSLIIDDKIYSRYADRLPNLKVIVVNLSYFSFNFRTAHCPEYWRSYQYLRTYGLNFREEAYWSGWLDLRSVSYYFLYGQGRSQEALFDRNIDFADSISPKGWEIHPHQSLRRNELFRTDDGAKTVAELNQVLRPEYRPTNVAAAESLIARAARHGVKVVFVALPVAPSFQRAEPDRLLSANKQIIQHFISDFSNVSFANYRTESDFVDSEFLDSFHLNSRGAAKFTPRLAKDAIAPLLQTVRVSSLLDAGRDQNGETSE